MDRSQFEAALQREGFRDIAVGAKPGGFHADEHAHEFEVRALMLTGDLTLTVAGQRRTYRPGEVFTMARGCLHAEDAGPAGASYVVGKKT
jgi:quercetin dioxygenase-like cupin family protein